jgi:hypothetical protein
VRSEDGINSLSDSSHPRPSPTSEEFEIDEAEEIIEPAQSPHDEPEPCVDIPSEVIPSQPEEEEISIFSKKGKKSKIYKRTSFFEGPSS